MAKPTVDCHLLDNVHLQYARTVTAAILLHVRATKRGRGVPPSLDEKLANLPPVVYLWHFFAWKMRGFRPGVELATTEDQKVVVISDTEILVGDPMTEEITRVVLPGGEESDTQPAPANPHLVTPKSRYRVH